MLYLYLHPAPEVVPEEVCRDRIQHVHLIGLEGHGLLVKVVPRATQLPGLIPDLLEKGIVLEKVYLKLPSLKDTHVHLTPNLNDDRVLYEASLRRGAGVAVVDGAAHSAAAEGDVERGLV